MIIILFLGKSIDNQKIITGQQFIRYTLQYILSFVLQPPLEYQ